MVDINALREAIEAQCANANWLEGSHIAFGELTLLVKREHLLNLCELLRDEPTFDFKLLADVCGVDYLEYGFADWETESTTETGFSRGVTAKKFPEPIESREDHRREDVGKGGKPNRFAVVYHLLSLTRNHRVRLRVNIPNDAELIVDSVIDLWPSANWFEREAFDLFGILFRGHPDLRRILTDYGFHGYPFRKDFPLIGKVEPRYDAKLKRVIYEPVSIEPRILEPKVIRHDHRYLQPKDEIHGK